MKDTYRVQHCPFICYLLKPFILSADSRPTTHTEILVIDSFSLLLDSTGPTRTLASTSPNSSPATSITSSPGRPVLASPLRSWTSPTTSSSQGGLAWPTTLSWPPSAPTFCPSGMRGWRTTGGPGGSSCQTRTTRIANISSWTRESDIHLVRKCQRL